VSKPLILFVGAIYLFIGIDQFRKGGTGQAIMWGGYALANIGLALTAK
jgi:hypothetical protein